MPVLIGDTSVTEAAIDIFYSTQYIKRIKALTIRGEQSCAQKKELLNFMILQVMNREQVEITTPICNCLKSQFNLMQSCDEPVPPPPTPSITFDSISPSCNSGKQVFTVNGSWENLTPSQNLTLQYNDGSSWIDVFMFPISQSSGTVSQAYSSGVTITPQLAYNFRLYSSTDDTSSNLVVSAAELCAPTIQINSLSAQCAFGAIELLSEAYFWNVPNDTIVVEYFDGAFWQGLVNIPVDQTGMGGLSPSIPYGTGTNLPSGNYTIRFRSSLYGVISEYPSQVQMGGC